MSRRNEESWKAFYEMVDNYMDRIYHGRAMLLDLDGYDWADDIDDFIDDKIDHYKTMYDGMSGMELHLRALVEMLEGGTSLEELKDAGVLFKEEN